MNIFSRTLILLFLTATLASCGSGQSAPTMSDAEIMQTAMATVSTVVAETQRAIPTNTPLPTGTPTSSAIPSRTVVPGSTGTAIFPPIESFIGIWYKFGSNPERWPRIVIGSDGSTLYANFREACELPDYWSFPTDCDGGSVSATYTGNPVLMITDGSTATINYTFSLNGDALHLTTFTDYADNSSRADSTAEYEFRKQGYAYPFDDEIVFFHFFEFGPHMPPGEYWTVATPIRLSAASWGDPYTSDTTSDLRKALELVLGHEANGWNSSDLEIVDIAFRDDHAEVVLQGEYFGESEDLLNAARLQILLTVFANPAVQTAAVTLNGVTIGNLGVSDITDAKPSDYVYTRAEIEKYVREHAFPLEFEGFILRPTQGAPNP